MTVDLIITFSILGGVLLLMLIVVICVLFYTIGAP